MKGTSPMKIITTAILIAVSTGAAFTPHAAQARDLVEFTLVSQELNGIEGRKNLLARIKIKAKKACAYGTYSSYYRSDNCVKDIQSQWIAAIANPALSALANPGSVSIASVSR
jgi:UrcA family protein